MTLKWGGDTNETNNNSSFNLNGQYFNSQLKSKQCDCTQHSLLTIRLRAPHLKRACTCQEMQCFPFILSETLCDPVATFTAVLPDACSWTRLDLDGRSPCDITSCQSCLSSIHANMSTGRYATRRQLCLLFTWGPQSHNTWCGWCQLKPKTVLKLKQTWVSLNVRNEQRSRTF